MKIRVHNLLTGRELTLDEKTFKILPDATDRSGKIYPNYGYVRIKEKKAPEPDAAKEARAAKPKPKKRVTKTKKNENSKGKK